MWGRKQTGDPSVDKIEITRRSRPKSTLVELRLPRELEQKLERKLARLLGSKPGRQLLSSRQSRQHRKQLLLPLWLFLETLGPSSVQRLGPRLVKRWREDLAGSWEPRQALLPGGWLELGLL